MVEQTDHGEILTLRLSNLFDETWFLSRNEDMAGVDALTHFHRYGWREHRWPNPYFDTGWYVRTYADIARLGRNPLLHYLEAGEAEGRRPVPWFDPIWYRTAQSVPSGQCALAHFLLNRRNGTVSPLPEFEAAHYVARYPDVAAADMDPFEHYLVQGAREDRQPHPGFDPVWYRRRYLPDRPDDNPLLHFLQHRGALGIFPAPPAAETDVFQEARRNTAPDPAFEEVRPRPAGTVLRARVLAFYLPQFHTVPENDAWWGRGFTEWTNIGRGLPRFAGHYQPRIPRDLGHYRLDDPATLRRQAELARGAGIEGFVFYYYRFGSRRLLERPIEALLADRDLDLPFALMWANENWTRRWDGMEQDVLLRQEYQPQDEGELLADFARHFRDPRYIRLGGRPLLMVYRADLLPDSAATVARWRARFRADHGEDPFLVMAQTFGHEDPAPHGMDAAVEFPPHKLTSQVPARTDLQVMDPAFTARVYDYDAVARASLDGTPPAYPLIKTAVPSWDNDARRQGAGLVLHGSTPARYQAWLDGLVSHARAHPVGGDALVCVNAWNEWAEGAYLEPDLRFGGAYLNATARAVAGLAAAASQGRMLLVGHDAFPAGSQLLLLNLGRQLVRAHGVQVRFLLLGGGKLATDYAEVAPTTVAADPAKWAGAVQAARADGVCAAILNTCATAQLAPVLDDAEITVTLLVHEMPRLLRERNLLTAARLGAARARRIVFAAPAVRDRFEAAVGPLDGRDVLLPQGLYRLPADDADARGRARAELGLRPGTVLAMGLGYADLRKGYDLFLQAWRAAHEAGEDALFLWVGDMDPALRGHLGEELAAAEASGSFRHLPYRAGVADLLPGADVFLLTSREDPFPTAALEAMAAGVPIAAFEGTGGIPDILRTHRAGAAVPLGHVARLAALAMSLARTTGTAQRKRLARIARAEFEFGRYAAALLSLGQPGLLSVSVAVPSHDYARYMPDRLNSVLAQTYPVREVLVLDDASQDDSADVARATARNWKRDVSVEVAERNGGSAFRAWRRAAERTTGEWVWIAEADDTAEPRFLETLAAALAPVPDAVMAFTDSRAIDAGGTELWPSYKAYCGQEHPGFLAADAVFEAADFLRRGMAVRNLMLNVSSVLWRRRALLAALDRCGEEAAGFSVAGDWRLYAEVLSGSTGKVVYVAEALNAHRRHASSLTGTLDAIRHVGEIRRVHRRIAAMLGNDPALMARQQAYRRQVAAELRRPRTGADVG